MHKHMELAGRMTELVLSPGALAAAITRFKANTCFPHYFHNAPKRRDCSLLALELSRVLPLLKGEESSQLSRNLAGGELLML